MLSLLGHYLNTGTILLRLTVSYCALLAVLVRFTEHTTLFVTLFYCRLHKSVLQSLFTLSTDPLMSCLGALF
jgi:hypothetical protein